jgi:hypothetical protein
MDDNNEEMNRIRHEIKDCFKELGLPILKEIIDNEGEAIIGTRIDSNRFSMFLEAVCSPTDAEVKIKAGFPGAFTAEDYFGLYQVLNLINGQWMDIAHFALNPSEGDILFRATVNMSDSGFSRKQLPISLVRLITHGMEWFDILLRVANTEQCPLKELKSAIDEMHQKRLEGRKE